MLALTLHVVLLLCVLFSLLQCSNSFSSATPLSLQLNRVSEALIEAGELTADMAGKLPNWYSSKEGLTGESPAVFGGCGMALIQAGQSLKIGSQESQIATEKCLFACVSDLASAACALDPIVLSEDMDAACGALHEMVTLLLLPENMDSMKEADDLQNQVVHGLQRCGRSFESYGKLLCAEDSNTGDSAAGRVLARAGQSLFQAGLAFSDISLPVLRTVLLTERIRDS